MHLRPPSLYEDIFGLGTTTFPVLLNILQSTSVVLICWIIVVSLYYSPLMIDAFSFYSLGIIICAIVVYVVAQTYLVAIAMKWITVLSSIEMKRNEKCIKKLINHQLKQAGKLSEDIFLQFKILFYEKTRENPSNEPQPKDGFELNNDNEDSVLNSQPSQINSKAKDFQLKHSPLIELIQANYRRYKGNTADPIMITTELKPFFESCGATLTAQDIQFICNLVEEIEDAEGKLCLGNLNDICGALLFFRNLKPHDVIRRVFKCYYIQNPKIYKETKSLKWKNIELFFQHHANYFSEEMLVYLKDACNYIGDAFSLEEFISMVATPRHFYSN